MAYENGFTERIIRSVALKAAAEAVKGIRKSNSAFVEKTVIGMAESFNAWLLKGCIQINEPAHGELELCRAGGEEND